MNVDITDHEGLVRLWAKRYGGRGVPIEDLEQEGRLGLMRAAQDWDAERGSFANYAAWWVRDYLQRAVRSQGSTIRRPVRGPSRRLVTSGLAVDPQAPPQWGDSERVAAALEGMHPNQRYVLERCYGLDGKPEESWDRIARRRGWDLWQVRLMFKGGRAAFREAFEDN